MDRLTELVRALGETLAAELAPAILAALPPRHDKQLPMMLDWEQISEQTGFSETTVRQLWRTGELPSVKVGGLKRTRRADFEAFVNDLPLDRSRALTAVRDAA